VAGKSQYKYKKEYCQMLIKHMTEGHSFESFGHVAKVHRKTMYTWAKRHKEFANAKDIAFSAALYWWEKEGIRGMQMGPKEFNAVVWIFSMKNRFGWRDVKEPDSEPGSKKDSGKFVINFSGERPKKISN